MARVMLKRAKKWFNFKISFPINRLFCFIVFKMSLRYGIRLTVILRLFHPTTVWTWATDSWTLAVFRWAIVYRGRVRWISNLLISGMLRLPCLYRFHSREIINFIAEETTFISRYLLWTIPQRLFILFNPHMSNWRQSILSFSISIFVWDHLTLRFISPHEFFLIFFQFLFVLL